MGFKFELVLGWEGLGGVRPTGSENPVPTLARKVRMSELFQVDYREGKQREPRLRGNSQQAVARLVPSPHRFAKLLRKLRIRDLFDALVEVGFHLPDDAVDAYRVATERD